MFGPGESGTLRTGIRSAAPKGTLDLSPLFIGSRAASAVRHLSSVCFHFFYFFLGSVSRATSVQVY